MFRLPSSYQEGTSSILASRCSRLISAVCDSCADLLSLSSPHSLREYWEKTITSIRRRWLLEDHPKYVWTGTNGTGRTPSNTPPLRGRRPSDDPFLSLTSKALQGESATTFEARDALPLCQYGTSRSILPLPSRERNLKSPRPLYPDPPMTWVRGFAGRQTL